TDTRSGTSPTHSLLVKSAASRSNPVGVAAARALPFLLRAPPRDDRVGPPVGLSTLRKRAIAPRAVLVFRPRIWGQEPDFAMTNVKFNTALIVGAGAGLSASLARALAKDGIKVALAARTTGDLDALVKQTGARALACDATERAQVEKLFADVDASL